MDILNWLQYAFLPLEIVVGFFLVMPAVSVGLARLKGLKHFKPDTENQQIEYGLIITAYQDASIADPLLESLVKQSYPKWKAYLVADNCDVSVLTVKDPRIIILQPQTGLGSKVKSILYGINHYQGAHEVTIVFDPDNLAHPDYLAQMNRFFNEGYVAVQGQRTAKNLDTVYACLDAMGETYYNCTTRRVPFTLGSSATIAGSGMGVRTDYYVSVINETLHQNVDKVIVAEDKILQSALVTQGHKIGYNTDAIVYDEKVATAGQVQRQRARWINSYFKYFAFNFGLFKSGIKRLSFNQLFFSYILVYPPMFLLVGCGLILSVIQLLISPSSWWVLPLCLVIFGLNFLGVLRLAKAPLPIWLSLWGIPLFVWKQVLAFLNIKQSNKDFLTTTHDRFYSIDEVLYAEKNHWNVGPRPTSQPVKILHIIRQGSFGGGETYLYSLVKGLNDGRFEHVVISFTDGEMVNRLHKEGIKTYVLPYLGFFHIKLIRSIYLIARKEHAELIHAHGTKAAFNSVLGALVTRIPMVYTVHGWSFHSGQSFFEGWMRRKVESYLVAKSTKTVLVSHSNLEEALSNGFSGQFAVIRNGINIQIFNPNEVLPSSREDFGLNSDDYVIASIARLTYQKGPEILIEAFDTVAKQIPNAKLLFVGGGELKLKCESVVSRLNLADRVVFTDFTGEVAEVLSMIDLYVLPSLWEGFSLSLLEAMAMGKKVIVSDYPANAEVVINCQTGLVFESKDPAALASQILYMYQNPEKASEMALAARDSVLKDFDFSRVLEENQELYGHLTRSNRVRLKPQVLHFTQV